MNKKVIIILSLIMFVSILIGISKKIDNQNNLLPNKELTNIKNNFYNIKNYFNNFSFQNSGTIDVDASYKGAHGEAHPKDYNFSFLMQEDKIIFENENGTDSLIISKELSEFINLVKLIRQINIDEIIDNYKVIKKKDKIIIKLNEDNINRYFNTSYKNIEIELYTKSIIKKVYKKVIKFDNNKMEINKNKYVINFNNNIINLDIVNNHNFSLNINDNLKLNAFIYDNVDKYSLVINDKAFLIEVYNNKLIIKSTEESLIYNGIELTVNFSKQLINEENIKNEDVPIIKYFNNLDLKFWR